jgi:hypothetical protein
LPPVSKDLAPSVGHWAFESSIWKDIFDSDNTIILCAIHRQSDPKFIQLLRQIRYNAIAAEGWRQMDTLLAKTQKAKHPHALRM